jgi:uncharacterized protein YbjT (DUF2867 family)
MSKKMNVLVTGATGNQGGAVAHLLLKNGHKVRALTRKGDSPAAKALAQAGAEIATGSLDDRAALDRALAGVDAAFAMSTPFEAGMEAETRQGVTMADAAKGAGVHLVFTSVGSADKHTGIPHFESKAAVERHIAAIGLKAAIIAPVYFMENAVAFGRAQLKEGVYATPLPPGRKVAQVALADIAAFAVLALENRDRFAGKRYDIAGDDVSGNDAVEILSRVTGKTFSYFQVPMAAIRKMSDDMVTMYEWFDRVGYQLDIAALKRDFPEVGWHSFEDWAKGLDWKSIFAG